MKLNNDLKSYIADVCGYIDSLFSILLIVYLIKAAFYGFTDNDWIALWVVIVGVVFWPTKKYVEKWLDVERDIFD